MPSQSRMKCGTTNPSEENDKHSKRMNHKKKTAQSPRVIQVTEVMLEQDLLQGPSSMSSVRTLGQEEEDFTATGENWYE